MPNLFDDANGLALERKMSSKPCPSRRDYFVVANQLTLAFAMVKCEVTMANSIPSSFFLFIVLSILGLTEVASSFSVVSASPSNLPSSENAEYVCYFESLWSAESHPTDYPENPVATTPFIVVHSPLYDLFQPNTPASPGMKSLAETGSIFDVVNEIFDVNGQDAKIIVDTVVGFDMDLRSTQRQTLRGVGLDMEHFLVSAFSRISPSPDWFTGFADFDARDVATNSWYSRFVLQTPPYDAGTQGGSTYTELLGDTTGMVTQITTATAPSSGVFLSLNENSVIAVLPVGEWTCILSNGEMLIPGTPDTLPPSPLSVSTLEPSTGPSAAALPSTTEIPEETSAPTQPPTTSPTGRPSPKPITRMPTKRPAVPEAETTPVPTGTPVSLSTPLPTWTRFQTVDDEILPPTLSPVTPLSDSPSSSPTSTLFVAVDDEILSPTVSPVASFSDSPSSLPSMALTDPPTTVPTGNPTAEPTDYPTAGPTDPLTDAPTMGLTFAPTAALETDSPTTKSSDSPSTVPSDVPSQESDLDQSEEENAAAETAEATNAPIAREDNTFAEQVDTSGVRSPFCHFLSLVFILAATFQF